MTAQDVIAEVLKGDEPLAAVVLNSLNAAGYAVIHLPKADYRERHGYGYNGTDGRLSDWGLFACTDDGRVYDQIGGVSSEDAWTIGSWWLAAAVDVFPAEQEGALP